MFDTDSNISVPSTPPKLKRVVNSAISVLIPENKKQISNLISGDIVSGLNVGNKHYSETLDIVASTSGVNISNNTNCTINVNIHPK